MHVSRDGAKMSGTLELKDGRVYLPIGGVLDLAHDFLEEVFDIHKANGEIFRVARLGSASQSLESPSGWTSNVLVGAVVPNSLEVLTPLFYCDAQNIQVGMSWWYTLHPVGHYRLPRTLEDGLRSNEAVMAVSVVR